MQTLIQTRDGRKLDVLISGDWLQLLAASSWLLSNISSILAIESNINEI